MTRQEYLEQNKAGFENDKFAREKFKHIIESNNIKTVIETGTYLGSTTKWLSQWADTVHTIEVNPENYSKAVKNLRENNNVEVWQGNSAELLKEILPLHKDEPLFIFLDAHWESYNPLIDELKVIADNKLKPIIAIHDFKVPGKPELGYDSYQGQDYDWSWIRSSVENIYGEDYTIEYNSEATGAKRGIIYIHPKK